MSDLSDDELISRMAAQTVPPLKEGAEAHEEMRFIPPEGTPSLGAQCQVTFWDEWGSPLAHTGLISLDPSQVMEPGTYKPGDPFKLHDKQYLIDGRRFRVQLIVTEG